MEAGGTAKSKFDACFVHGGQIAAARQRFPDSPLPWIDLSTGINPFSWDVDQAGQIDWTRLPEASDLAALEAAAAKHFGVAPERVCAVPGTELAIRLLDSLHLSLPCRHVAPGYGGYQDAWPESVGISREDIERECKRGGTIIVGRPNNPDGWIAERSALLLAAKTIGRAGGAIVVDEAFADAIGEPSIALEAENIVALRSFGKFFGLGGVRLGFVIASPTRLEGLRRRLGSWPVSAAAITIGTRAYSDRPWIAGMAGRLEEEKQKLDALLGRCGLGAQGESPLFRLVRVQNAHQLFERLAAGGVLTRPFDYAPEWLRIGLPADNHAYGRLEEALRSG